MALKYVIGVMDRENYLSYLHEENFPKRKKLSESLNTRYNELVNSKGK